jgi:hypothetical protein
LDTTQAKDFLVAQATRQAELDGVSLTDVEKRMMYFTESDPSSCETPIELNDEFERKYDTNEYEAKISRLLHRARGSVKKENPQQLRIWDQAIRTLRKGDHYILVMVGQSRDFGLGWWMPVFWGIGISVVLFIVAIVKDALGARGLIPNWLFGWISNDPRTQMEAFYLIVVGSFGLWGLITLARAGDFDAEIKASRQRLLSPFSFLSRKRRSRK